MNYVVLALDVFFHLLPYGLAAAAGAYVEHKAGAKLVARVAALEAAAKADVAKVEAKV